MNENNIRKLLQSCNQSDILLGIEFLNSYELEDLRRIFDDSMRESGMLAIPGCIKTAYEGPMFWIRQRDRTYFVSSGCVIILKPDFSEIYQESNYGKSPSTKS